MNVYRCWHQGIKGYGCRIRDSKWMFVPELGQPDNRTHKNLELVDLEFVNRFEKEHEMRREASLFNDPLRRFVSDLVGNQRKPVTVYGKLLLS